MKKTRRKIDAGLKAKIALDAAGAVDGGGSVATVRGPPEPNLRMEEAAAGAGGPSL